MNTDSNSSSDPEIVFKTAITNIHNSKSIEEAIEIIKDAKR